MMITSSVRSHRDRPSPPPLEMAATLSADERATVLRFAASFLWADLEVVDAERAFLQELARELQVENASLEVANLLSVPPTPEEVDPHDIDKLEIANAIRHVVLRAIASDGVVAETEMNLFELLDDLLPKPSYES